MKYEKEEHTRSAKYAAEHRERVSATLHAQHMHTARRERPGAYVWRFISQRELFSEGDYLARCPPSSIGLSPFLPQAKASFDAFGVNSANSLSKFGPGVAAMADMVEKNKHVFRGKAPIGPVGKYITLTEEKWK